MKKIVDKKFIFGIIIGLILSATTVYAVTCVAASDVSFTSTTGLSSTNVQDAINQVDNNLYKYTSQLSDLRNNEVVLYEYDEDKESSTYCIYGYEATCTRRYSTSDLPIGTIVSVKNSNSSSRSNYWVISSDKPSFDNSYNLLSQDNYKISNIDTYYTDYSSFYNKINEYNNNFDYLFKNNSKVGKSQLVGNNDYYLHKATKGTSFAIDTDDYSYIEYNYFASEPEQESYLISNSKFDTEYVAIAELEDIKKACKDAYVTTSSRSSLKSSIGTPYSSGMYVLSECPMFLNEIFNVATLIRDNDLETYQPITMMNYYSETFNFLDLAPYYVDSNVRNNVGYKIVVRYTP